MTKTTISIACVFVVLITLGAGGIWWFQSRFLPTAFTEDAVQVIGYEASRMFHRDPATSQADIDQMIRSQHDASNINLEIDSMGRAVDPFGKAFRVQHRVERQKSITTVVSAGPDRKFDTRDDIIFKHER